MRRMLPALVLGLLLAPAALAATPPKAGTYEVTMLMTPASGTIYCLVKITPKDGGVDGELVSANPRMQGLDLKGVTLDGDTLRVVIQGPAGELTFEGRVAKADADTVLGTF